MPEGSEPSSASAPDRRREQNRLAQRRFRQRHGTRRSTDSANNGAAIGAPHGNVDEADQTQSLSQTVPGAVSALDVTNRSIADHNNIGGNPEISSRDPGPLSFDDFVTFGDGLNALDIPGMTSAAIPPAPLAQSQIDLAPLHPQQSHVSDASTSLSKVDTNPEALDTPLHMAARQGSVNIVKLLLKRGAECDAEGPQSMTPLACAICENHESAASVLLAHGARMSAVDGHGRSVFHLAVIHDCERLLRLLTEHMGSNNSVVNEYDQGGNTPLHLAISMDHASAVEALCDAGANLQAPPARTSPRPR